MASRATRAWLEADAAQVEARAAAEAARAARVAAEAASRAARALETAHIEQNREKRMRAAQSQWPPPPPAALQFGRDLPLPPPPPPDMLEAPPPSRDWNRRPRPPQNPPPPGLMHRAGRSSQWHSDPLVSSGSSSEDDDDEGEPGWDDKYERAIAQEFINSLPPDNDDLDRAAEGVWEGTAARPWAGDRDVPPPSPRYVRLEPKSKYRAQPGPCSPERLHGPLKPVAKRRATVARVSLSSSSRPPHECLACVILG